jgi:dTDP-4-dehydrorhamnose 3,5-epimerase
MKVDNTKIEDLKIITPDVFEDERGFFYESFSAKKYKEHIGEFVKFTQDNVSYSVAGSVRGLHFQIGKPQGKLIQCLKGIVFDVAVDLRKESETFGEYSWVILSERNKKQFWIPPGFAHGFMALDEHNIIQYKCSEEYFPLGERTLQWDDEEVGIKWPHCPNLTISSKDKKGETLTELINKKEIFSV